MNSRPRVLTVFGTRPEAIKMAPVVRALARRSHEFESIVVSTGQHREMLDSVLRLFQIEPDCDLGVMRPNQTLAGITASVLEKLDPILADVRPDWVLVQGDTTTAMAGSMAAFYRRIPVGHIEAGLRTADRAQPFPEEINRRITGVVADLHFAPTAWAADNLLREGVPGESVLVTGNTVIDAIQDVSQRRFDPTGTDLAAVAATSKRVIVVTAHRRESFGDGMLQICAALAELANRDDVHIVYPVHLNPQVQEPVRRLLGEHPNITLLPPQDYRPMVWLLQRSSLVITDSGGLQEEAPGLGKPVLVLRERTERPEGVEAGTVKLVGTDRRTIIDAASTLLDDRLAYGRMANAVNPYGDGRAAERILGALLGQRLPAPVAQFHELAGAAPS